MKLIKPKAELLIQESGLDGIYRQIEKCGRTCYRSEDKITEDSAKPFVDRMIASKHTAMLEHGTVYLKLDISDETVEQSCIGEKNEVDIINKYLNNKYSKVIYDKNYSTLFTKKGETSAHITTNLRVLVENNWLDDLQYICEPTEFHEKRYTFRMTTSIGVTRELNRHRVNSIAEQSTRYCNFSKDKFGNEVSFCIPEWVGNTPDKTSPENFLFVGYLQMAEEGYFVLLNKGWQPQQAREVLPLCTATEIVHTAFASDFKHFFDLRLFGKTGNPHPNMYQLAKLMKVEAEKRGIWEDIMKQPSKFD